MTPGPPRLCSQWNKEGAERPMMLEAVGAQEGRGGGVIVRAGTKESHSLKEVTKKGELDQTKGRVRLDPSPPLPPPTSKKNI